MHGETNITVKRWTGAALLLLAVASSLSAYGQSVPSDLTIRASAGGVDPWEDVVSLHVDADGQALFTRYLPGNLDDPPLEQHTFTLSAEALERIWQAIQSNDFFNLDPAFRHGEINARTFARLSIRANGDVHEVTTRNIAVHAFDNIVAAINRATPEDRNLVYDTSEPPFIFVKDPCSGLPPGAFLEAPLETYGVKKGTSAAPPAGSSPLHADPHTDNTAHPATVVHANMPLGEAVSRGIATLEPKGRFFGDAVSITVDNTGRFTSDKIGITLYMQFWGPTATPENVDRIEEAIERAWSFEGLLTDDLQYVDVNMNVVPRLDEEAFAPPGTPGYHQIKLVENVRSNVVGGGTSFDVNRGAGSGTWRTEGPNLDGMYAHEAGHLLGLPDRYDEYERTWLLDDEPWTRESDGARFSNEELAQIIADNEHRSFEEVLDKVENTPWKDRLTTPRAPGLSTDLMADTRGFVNLDDVLDLIKQAGLLVYVQPGDAFISRDPQAQNLITTKLENVFAPPGEIKRLEGIYAACIDALEGVPMPGSPLDLGPPLDTWQGIRAAELLLAFLRSTSAQDAYCLDGTQFGTWRITDNNSMNNPALRVFMENHGVILEEAFLDFPRLSNPNDGDAATGRVLPPELFVTRITPAATLTQAGQTVALNWDLTPPSGVEVADTDFSWSLQKPDGSSASLTDPLGETAQFIPDVRGFYRPMLNLSVTPVDWPEAAIVKRARVVAADDLTDTFERDSLSSERFPWQTSAEAPWTLSDLAPHSGGFSARSGAIGDNDTTTLAIRLFLPEPGEISFAYRIHASKDSDSLQFYIDGIEQGAWTGVVDWGHASFPVGAGHHTFTWKYVKDFFGAFGADAAWIDDVFFPGTAMPTAVAQDEVLPSAYQLSQNFPNPFNPITTISYALPASQEVTLAVYDLLGRRVATLVDGRRSAGHHQVSFDATHLPSGVYYYRLAAGSFSEVRSMVLLK